MLAVARFALHHPLATFSLEHVRHGQSGAGCGVAFRLEMDGRFRFIAMKRDRGYRDIHGRKIASLRKILHHSTTNGILALDVLLAPAQQHQAQKDPGAGDNNRAFHTQIVAQTLPAVPLR